MRSPWGCARVKREAAEQVDEEEAAQVLLGDAHVVGDDLHVVVEVRDEKVEDEVGEEERVDTELDGTGGEESRGRVQEQLKSEAQRHLDRLVAEHRRDHDLPPADARVVRVDHGAAAALPIRVSLAFPPPAPVSFTPPPCANLHIQELIAAPKLDAVAFDDQS